MTHGLQLLPQQSPAAGLTGFSALAAAARRAVSRIGARRDFSRRVRVGESVWRSFFEGMGTITVRREDVERGGERLNKIDLLWYFVFCILYVILLFAVCCLMFDVRLSHCVG